MFSLVYKILKITEHFWKGNQKAVNSDSLLGGYRGRGLTFSSYAVIDILKTTILVVHIHCSSPSNALTATLVTPTPPLAPAYLLRIQQVRV